MIYGLSKRVLLQNLYSQVQIMNIFNEHNKQKHNHALDLAIKAKTKLLELNYSNVTAKIFLAMTINIDPEHKGISQTTLYRNKEIHDVFVSINQRFQSLTQISHKRKRRHKWKRKLSPYNEKENVEQFDGFRRKVLIKLIVDLRMQLSTKKFEIENLRKEKNNQQINLTKQTLKIAELQKTIRDMMGNKDHSSDFD